MDIKHAVWNLEKVPDLPKEKQIEILKKLQTRVHELFDALVIAESFLEANCHYTDEMAPIYRALGKGVPNVPSMQQDSREMEKENGND